MKPNAKRSATRRAPVQERAQVTVEAMLDAAIKLLKRGGASSITTNRIAETAGVSIGSVYQYFPNKRAIFIALHDRHIRQVDSVMERRIAESGDATLEGLIASLIDGMIEAHAVDPELPHLLQAEVPHRANETRDFSVRLHAAFRTALASHARELGDRIDLDMRTFFVSNMVDALGHAILLRRPTGSSLSRARAELLRAILAYLRD
ncbi:MAG: TetR/AcrR family transcriptional regulator [Terriglobales bacterium]